MHIGGKPHLRRHHFRACDLEARLGQREGYLGDERPVEPIADGADAAEHELVPGVAKLRFQCFRASPKPIGQHFRRQAPAAELVLECGGRRQYVVDAVSDLVFDATAQRACKPAVEFGEVVHGIVAGRPRSGPAKQVQGEAAGPPDDQQPIGALGERLHPLEHRLPDKPSDGGQRHGRVRRPYRWRHHFQRFLDVRADPGTRPPEVGEPRPSARIGIDPEGAPPGTPVEERNEAMRSLSEAGIWHRRDVDEPHCSAPKSARCRTMRSAAAPSP